jgi:hypothetical protein
MVAGFWEAGWPDPDGWTGVGAVAAPLDDPASGAGAAWAVAVAAASMIGGGFEVG